MWINFFFIHWKFNRISRSINLLRKGSLWILSVCVCAFTYQCGAHNERYRNKKGKTSDPYLYFCLFVCLLLYLSNTFFILFVNFFFIFLVSFVLLRKQLMMNRIQLWYLTTKRNYHWRCEFQQLPLSKFDIFPLFILFRLGCLYENILKNLFRGIFHFLRCVKGGGGSRICYASY